MIFMTDPIDIYSKPIKITDYKIGRVFYMKPRKDPKKPGRILVVNYDKRFPFIKNFIVRYSYYVHFTKSGNIAGNHYHRKKQELFIPIVGKFIVNLEDIKTNKKKSISIQSNKYPIVFIPTKVSHKVTSQTDNSILLVLATSPGTRNDEHNYVINQ